MRFRLTAETVSKKQNNKNTNNLGKQLSLNSGPRMQSQYICVYMPSLSCPHTHMNMCMCQKQTHLPNNKIPAKRKSSWNLQGHTGVHCRTGNRGQMGQTPRSIIPVQPRVHLLSRDLMFLKRVLFYLSNSL